MTNKTTTTRAKSLLQSIVVPLLLGLAMTFGYAPFSQWYLIPALLTGFMLVLMRAERPALTGFMFGLGWFGAGVSWVHVSIADYGGFHISIAIALTALLAAYLALYPLLFAWLLSRFIPRAQWVWFAPLFWLTVEWLRGVLLTGFSWLSVGYSQIDGPLAGWFAVIGELGLSALLVLFATMMARLILNKSYLNMVLIMTLMVSMGVLLKSVNWRTQTASDVTITLVQGNIPQSVRWQPEAEASTMAKYVNLTEPHWDSDIIIWPEAAIPAIEPRKISQRYLNRLDLVAASTHTALITGILNTDYPDAWNAVIVIGETEPQSGLASYSHNHANRYYKHHLLPIGEFVPFEDWLRSLGGVFDLPWSSFARGDYQQPNLLAKGYQLVPALCFEILFAEQIRANLTPDSDFILTVSNDAWFGTWHGPHQHMEIARVRAAEMGLPVLRATNTGVTAFVDDKGEFISRLPQFEANTLTAKVPSIRSATPYRNWGNLPNWLWALAIAIVGLTLIVRRR